MFCCIKIRRSHLENEIILCDIHTQDDVRYPPAKKNEVSERPGARNFKTGYMWGMYTCLRKDLTMRRDGERLLNLTQVVGIFSELGNATGNLTPAHSPIEISMKLRSMLSVS